MQRDETKEVGIWLRVSTEDQVRGESLLHHEKRALAYAEAKGWHVVETYRLDAVSGKAVLQHAEAQRMLKDIRSGRISGLVFSKLARLARNTKELLEIAEVFRASGADLISLQESIDTSTPAGRLFFTMIAAMSQWEREEIASRVAASVPIRARLGKPTGGQAPFGYRWLDGKLEAHPDEAPVRLLLHELYAEHKGRRTVARLLNERGYRTRNGSKFSDTTIERLLQDTTARGQRRANYTQTDDHTCSWKLKPESEWVIVEVEPIVPAELFDRCTAILADQRQAERPKRATVHLFAGFARCACGTKMYVRHGSPKYICDACRNKIPAADLEAVYREQLHSFLLSPDEIAAHTNATAGALQEVERLLDVARGELRQLQASEDQLFDLYSGGALPREDFARRHRPLSERRAALDAELPELEAKADALRIGELSQAEAIEGAKSLWSRWEMMEDAEKRSIIEAITDHIIIADGDIEIGLLRLPFEASNDNDATNPHGRVAFWRLPMPLTLCALKPEIKELAGSSLGTQLRKRRRELKLRRSDAAAIIGCDGKSLMWWERDEREPAIRFYPAIIEFLGGEPWPTPETMSERLLAERRRRGLTIREAAGLANVDEATFMNWGLGVMPKHGSTREKLADFVRRT